MLADVLLGDAETIFIDEGFTPQLIAEALPTNRPLTVGFYVPWDESSTSSLRSRSTATPAKYRS